MALSSGMGVRRGPGIPLRMTKNEKAKLKKMANAVGLSMAEYVRCKIFEIPFHLVGGKEVKTVKENQ